MQCLRQASCFSCAGFQKKEHFSDEELSKLLHDPSIIHENALWKQIQKRDPRVKKLIRCFKKNLKVEIKSFGHQDSWKNTLKSLDAIEESKRQEKALSLHEKRLCFLNKLCKLMDHIGQTLNRRDFHYTAFGRKGPYSDVDINIVFDENKAEPWQMIEQKVLIDSLFETLGLRDMKETLDAEFFIQHTAELFPKIKKGQKPFYSQVILSIHFIQALHLLSEDAWEHYYEELRDFRQSVPCIEEIIEDAKTFIQAFRQKEALLCHEGEKKNIIILLEFAKIIQEIITFSEHEDQLLLFRPTKDLQEMKMLLVWSLLNLSIDESYFLPGTFRSVCSARGGQIEQRSDEELQKAFQEGKTINKKQFDPPSLLDLGQSKAENALIFIHKLEKTQKTASEQPKYEDLLAAFKFRQRIDEEDLEFGLRKNELESSNHESSIQSVRRQSLISETQELPPPYNRRFSFGFFDLKRKSAASLDMSVKGAECVVRKSLTGQISEDESPARELRKLSIKTSLSSIDSDTESPSRRRMRSLFNTCEEMSQKRRNLSFSSQTQAIRHKNYLTKEQAMLLFEHLMEKQTKFQEELIERLSNAPMQEALQIVFSAYYEHYEGQMLPQDLDRCLREKYQNCQNTEEIIEQTQDLLFGWQGSEESLDRRYEKARKELLRHYAYTSPGNRHFEPMTFAQNQIDALMMHLYYLGISGAYPERDQGEDICAYHCANPDLEEFIRAMLRTTKLPQRFFSSSNKLKENLLNIEQHKKESLQMAAATWQDCFTLELLELEQFNKALSAMQIFKKFLEAGL